MSDVFYRDATGRYPVAVKADGMYIWDNAGRAYLDMSGGAAVSCLGHGHPRVVEALTKQIEQMAFAHTGFFSNEPQEQLAEMLSSKFGEEGAKVYFTSGGSEANETALKMVWQYWQAMGKMDKVKIISREHSYHGNTLGALSVSGNPSRRKSMDNILIDWPRIAPCYSYRLQGDDETEIEYGVRAAKSLEDTIVREGADTIAAFIAEPVVGASLGVVPAAEGYFKKIREICDQHNILLIADEIMCGTGRVGAFYAHEQDGFTPDIVTLAKGVGGGYQPLAATVVRKKITDIFMHAENSFSHGHTYVGHATACTAGVAVINSIDDGCYIDRVNNQGRAFEHALRSEFSSHPNVGDIRGRGLFYGMEFVMDKDSKEPFSNGAVIAGQLKKSAMQNGLICYPGAGASAHIMFAPPFILGQDHIDEAVSKLKNVFKEVFDA